MLIVLAIELYVYVGCDCMMIEWSFDWLSEKPKLGEYCNENYDRM